MSDWKLIFSTNQAGAVMFGSVNALKAAVLAAADVKVLYSPTAGTWWSRHCSSVTTRGTGGSSLVTATYMEAADTRVGPSELEFETPFALEYHLYNSNGVRKVVKIEHATGKVLQNSSSVIPMRWYVKDYQLPWWVLQPVVANVDLDRLLTMDDVEKGR